MLLFLLLRSVMAINRNKKENSEQNAYCSLDIYFQFKRVCRSVISRVIIHRLLKRSSIIGCHKRTTILISMMEVANRTMDAARYRVCSWWPCWRSKTIKAICIKIKLFSQWKGILLFFFSNMAAANRRYCFPFCFAKWYTCIISLKTFHQMVFNFGL